MEKMKQIVQFPRDPLENAPIVRRLGGILSSEATAQDHRKHLEEKYSQRNLPMSILVVGDIHGCYHEFRALLDKAALASSDRIIAIGDIVDRGPETPQVLDYFRTSPQTQTLMGNHERKHVRAGRGEIQLSLSQRISQIQLAEDYPRAVEWMSSLQIFVELPDAILVHGYLEPGIPLAEQNPSILCGTMGGEMVLRNRYDRPWYELYDGNRPAIVGHRNYTDSDQPFIYKDRIFGLDTSCVMGKALTGILLPAFQIISVPSRGNLWEGVRWEYRSGRKPDTIQAIVSWSEQDDVALAELIAKVETTSDAILTRLRSSPRYSRLKPRQQARMYAARVGDGPAAVLLQLARLGKLDLEAARRVVRKMERIGEITGQVDVIYSG